ncbi:MAG: hypothetical protein ACFE8L_03045 [Candidatus Hodarchaeota archaeon]
MGLDKWLKPDEEGKKIKKRAKEDKDLSLQKVSKPKKEKNDITAHKSAERTIKKLSKFELICTNRKCKYQKTIMKKLLTEKDKTCPRCSGIMKVKKLN